MTVELLTPTIAYALTSGPSQPETKGFEAIGNSNMVDPFSGDFSYNIPLLDVGGYPVNLAYHSGASMDDEASWAGYGWSVNVGSLNRQLRGLPDDFNGTDQQERELSMKDHITKGGRFSMTLDLLGIPVSKITKKLKKKKLNFATTFSIGVKHDNYRGVGMEIGANTGVSLTDYVATDKDPKKDSATGSLNLGLNLSSTEGASVSLNRDVLLKNLDKGETSLSKSIGFGYNSRAGLTGMTLTNSTKSANEKNPMRSFDLSSSFISFNSDSYTPSITHATKSNSFNFSMHLGPEVQIVLPGLGVSGFYSSQTTAERLRKLPSYGYLHSEKGKENPYALSDMNREKDIPYSREVKYLPIPVPTYDLFSASSQDGAGQYRAYRGSSAVYGDTKTETNSDNYSLGIEVGAGTYFDVGADLYKQDIKSKTQKWTDRNNFLSKGDFPSVTEPLYEATYFKRVGEPTPASEDYISKVKGTSPIAVSLPKNIKNAVAGAEASENLRTKNARVESTTALYRDKREVRNTTFSYLTAKEASLHGLDKTIKDYNPDSIVLNNCNTVGIRNVFDRWSGYRKGHHLSEITITGDDGKRSVYGIPVYNTYQEEVSFSIGQDHSKRSKGLIPFAKGTDDTVYNKKGRENYYSKEVTSPYATSYLLTAILSPDYVDKTGNGITDDDNGTAVKFNYTRLNSFYNWRTPYAGAAGMANYNEGFLSDALDDKANYVYGQKEVWYLHSIESKTMVAHFITEDRKDGLGVLNDAGGVNTGTRLKRLKEIRLYSKSDLKLAGNDPSKATPIKVVHLVHSYSIFRGLPNSEGQVGKLTLDKVYFTFGFNNKGNLNPYEFAYDTTAYNTYDYRQYDRWGNFKDAAHNQGGLNNSEFPYTLQDTALSNKFASLWQLNRISLPSGGTINVKYESDDYAYVQDKRASQMCMLNGIGTQGTATGLINADHILINLPAPVSSRTEMLEKYFEGMDKIYFKFYMDLDGLGHKEFVPGYAAIIGQPELIGNNIARIRIEKVKSRNIIAIAGWQFLRMNLPKYAYPGSENIESQDSDLKKVIKALVTAFGSIKELVYGFEKRAANKGFSNTVELQKSWVRLCSPEKRKLGGGSRVRRVDISDNWAEMTSVPGAKTATYTQLYDYTTKDNRGRTVSSGVASYEPMIGNDENPFRQPINYKQKQFLGLDNYYYIEQPFCESFFPAASVGYSKVTVKSIGTGDDEFANRTGWVEHEFFTANDYPTTVDILGLEERKPISNVLFKLIGGVSYEMLGLSQGYSVSLNDMHGKPKSVKVFNKSGQKISSETYFYKTANEFAEKKELNNDVKVISPNGQVRDAAIGMDVEVYTDMRQHTTDNLGVSVKVSGGSGAILVFPLPFFFPGIGVNYDKRSYRASSTIKIINRFAVQYKVRKMQNGSSIETENLLWDAETGNVLLTKTQNAFDDPVYSFAYPAHWAYNGMAQAYQNLGTVLADFSTEPTGAISNDAYSELLMPGDELIDVASAAKYWVINTPATDGKRKRIIDGNGAIQQVSNLTVKLLRSGRRNMANAAIATITSLKNPIVNNQLDISTATKVLDAKATIFKEEWEMPVGQCNTCPQDYKLSPDGQSCVSETAPNVSSGCYTVCQGSHNASYSIDGTEIYGAGFNLDGTGQVVASVTDPNNKLWVGGSCTTTTLNLYSKTQSSPASATFQKSTLESGADSAGMDNDSLSEYSSTSIQASSNEGNDAVALDPSTCTLEPSAPWNTQLCGPLHRTSIWTCQAGNQPFGAWLGFSKCINVSSTKTYYIGIAGDNGVQFYVDGVLKLSFLDCGSQSPFKKWRIYPITLEAGQHIIELEGYNCDKDAAFGAEIYDNTVQQLQAATDTLQLNRIFSTRQMVGLDFDRGRYSCPQGYALNTCASPFTCKSVIPLGINGLINPYVTGTLGNWRPQSQFIYQVDRQTLITDVSKKSSTDIRKSGAYSVFNPFWSYSGTWAQNTWDPRWIAANEVTYFNTKGTEIENKDALNRYSSALFGYLESMPIAVASNARYREIAYDGFEDYNFLLDCKAEAACSEGHFNFKKQLSAAVSLTGEEAHSGKYSLLVNGSATLDKSVYTTPTTEIYTYNDQGQYLFGSNEIAKGFSPIPGKKYILSFWVKDGVPRDATTPVQAVINGTSLISNLSKWPVVDGWKRVEVPFVVSAMASGFSLQLSGNNVYIDDIRIYPDEGQLKSFAYDASSQRLMAELDENNFATFYEYDDKGILIRIKKETERGIMTIKETRSAHRKKTL